MPLERPRRISPPAPPGSMLKSATAAQPRISQTERKPDYLALIRQLPCLYCGQQPCGESAHVNFSSAEFGRVNSLGKHSQDKFAVPICGEDHRIAKHSQHRGGEEAWWNSLGIEPYQVARQLWDKREDFVAMENIIRVAIADRDKR